VRSRVARFAAVVLLAAGCTAGDRAWGNNLFGVAAGPGQPGIAVAVYSCPGMTLQSAALQELNSRGDIQTTLWQIHRVSPGPDPAELIPGIVPAGFAQDVVLRQPTRDGWAGVQLTQGGYVNGLDFHLASSTPRPYSSTKRGSAATITCPARPSRPRTRRTASLATRRRAAPPTSQSPIGYR
jgi:hypothetical protein